MTIICVVRIHIFYFTLIYHNRDYSKLELHAAAYLNLQKNQGRRNEKRTRGADFVEGHRQNYNYVKIHTLEFKGSVVFLLRQIFTDHILSIASAITLDINTSRISSIDSVTVGLLSLTKGTLKTCCYIIFFILKGHFCPPCPSQQKAREAATPPTPQFRRP